MNIEEQFNLIAKEYDANRRKFIPCFDDYYIATTDFISANITNPKRILDLGAATGLLTYYWYRKFKTAEYVLVDIADEMLNVAKKRFENLKNIEFTVSDYTKALPNGEFDCIISALSIHHLENSEKQELFNRIYERLPIGGVFVNYDQFCGGSVVRFLPNGISRKQRIDPQRYRIMERTQKIGQRTIRRSGSRDAAKK